MPSIGVAKSRLLGDFAAPPAEPGAWTPVVDLREVVGAVVRRRRGVKPVFVFPGHRSTSRAQSASPSPVRRYRLPEPSRAGHRLGSER